MEGRGARRRRRKRRGGCRWRRSAVSMSASTTPSTLLATICIVDSSLAVAIEWARIFPDYLAPIIQRLAELTTNVNQVRPSPRSQLCCSPSPVQDRIHHLWSCVLSSLASPLSAFLPAISSDEQGDERRTRKVLHRPDWHRFQLRRYGCSRRHRRRTRGTYPQLAINVPSRLTLADVRQVTPVYRRPSRSIADTTVKQTARNSYLTHRSSRCCPSGRVAASSLERKLQIRPAHVGHPPRRVQTGTSSPLSPLSSFSPLPTATNQLQHRDHSTHPSFQRDFPLCSYLFPLLSRSFAHRTQD